MKSIILYCSILFLTADACTKTNDQPKSKTDFIPIISANTPALVTQGQPIISDVKCGFYSHFADITFLNFDIIERLPKQYEIRAKAFYDNIQYEFSLPVVSTFDTLMTIQTSTPGQYILKFYTTNELVQSDTVQVN